MALHAVEPNSDNRSVCADRHRGQATRGRKRSGCALSVAAARPGGAMPYRRSFSAAAGVSQSVDHGG